VSSLARCAPKLAKLHPILGGGSSQVYAADGSRLGFIQADELRTPVSWNEIPTALRDASVAIEDQRFYKHKGVDLTAIFRAAVKDITHGSIVQGGSTITMQLMRNLYLGGDQHSLRQKIIEAQLALEYEKRHSKHEILTSYLNSVPYGTVGGQTAIGVQAASRIFFDKPVWSLNLQRTWPDSGATRCSRRWRTCTTSPRSRQRARRLRRWKSNEATSTPNVGRISSSNTYASS
jgi:penicillin-binding protein 1A